MELNMNDLLYFGIVAPAGLIIAFVLAKMVNITEQDRIPVAIICGLLGFLWPVSIPLGFIVFINVWLLKHISSVP